jgi:hypothetical protein
MSDPGANNRHRVDAVKALDALATPPGQAGCARLESHNHQN